jgi:hypothetical protein
MAQRIRRRVVDAARSRASPKSGCASCRSSSLTTGDPRARKPTRAIGRPTGAEPPREEILAQGPATARYGAPTSSCRPPHRGTRPVRPGSSALGCRPNAARAPPAAGVSSRQAPRSAPHRAGSLHSATPPRSPAPGAGLPSSVAVPIPASPLRRTQPGQPITAAVKHQLSEIVRVAGGGVVRSAVKAPRSAAR